MHCDLYLDNIIMLFNHKGRKTQAFYYMDLLHTFITYFQCEDNSEN